MSRRPLLYLWLVLGIILGLGALWVYWTMKLPLALRSELSISGAAFALFTLGASTAIGAGFTILAEKLAHQADATRDDTMDVKPEEFRFQIDALPPVSDEAEVRRMTAELATLCQDKASLDSRQKIVAALAKVQPGPTRFEIVKTSLDLLNTRLNNEYAGVSERVGWLVTSQAFLVGAYATVLNNTAISSTDRFLILLGITGVGLAASIALSAGIFFGHAWCERMKLTRQQVEKEALKFNIPRTGVPASYGAHTVGHFATKLLAALAITAWIGLLVLVVIDGLVRVPSPAVG